MHNKKIIIKHSFLSYNELCTQLPQEIITMYSNAVGVVFSQNKL